MVLLSFVFILAFSVDAEAQSRKKKKKGKQRPAKTEQTDDRDSEGDRSGESSRSQRSSGSERSSRVSDDGRVKGFSTDKLVYDVLGDFRVPFRGPTSTVLKFGLKPAVSYKVLPRLAFGVAPKIEYYFFSNVNDEDGHEFDLGIEGFGRFLVFETVYLQVGYDFNNATFWLPPGRREWINSTVIGGGYMSGFGQWKYGAQALLNLNEERADQYGLLELWFGLTYNF